MPEFLFVMLIWTGGHGGPATISGFHSIETCKAAIPDVQRGFLNTGVSLTWNGPVCVALKAK